MAGLYGDFVAKTISQGDVAVTASAWVPLVSGATEGVTGVTTGLLPLQSRRHIRYQLKSNPGGALAVVYVAKNLDGTFTTPTSASVKTATVFPGNTTIVEPIGDAIQVFGKLVKKKGFAFDSIRVIVTEFA